MSPGDALESLASLDFSLRLIRIKDVHILLVVQPFLFSEVSVKCDGTEGTSGSVSSIKERFGIVEKVGEEVVRLPHSVGSGDVHRGGSYFHALTHVVFDGSDSATILLVHIMFQNFIIGVFFLSNWSIDVAKVLCRY